MATCSNCGAESSRVRSRWLESKQLPDECPNCSPQAFDGKFTAPSDKKIWMGYEAHPNEYIASPDGGYDRKPEYRAEQEDKLRQPCEEDRIKQEAAVENKRKERRTIPMEPAELLHAIAKARAIAEGMERAVEAEKEQEKQAELDAWIQKASHA